MSEPKVTRVTYRSGIHPTTGWDVIHVIYEGEDPVTGAKRPVYSFTVARDAEGTIRRKSDILLDRWETVTDEGDLGSLRSVFEERDRCMAKAQGSPDQSEPAS